MPNYDFFCQDCQKQFSVYASYAEYDGLQARCPRCGSSKVRRALNRVRLAHSDREHLQRLSSGFNGNADSQSLGRMMRGVQEQSGVKMDGPFDEVVGRLEKGESMEKIDRDYE